MRAVMILCATARDLEASTATTLVPTLEMSQVPLTAECLAFEQFLPEEEEQEDDQDAETKTEKRFEVPPHKVSPAVPMVTIPGYQECLLIWSSHALGVTQRTQVDHVRHFLRDQLVVFKELDSVLLTTEMRKVITHYSGEPDGVFPQLFVYAGRDTRYIPFAQLEEAEFTAHMSLTQLAREGLLLKSALYHFKDVPTLALADHTFYGEFKKFKRFSIVDEELHAQYSTSTVTCAGRLRA